jgi:hypothetical protein
MSTLISEQSEDLKGANFELGLDEPLSERETESLKMFNEDEEPFIVRRMSEFGESFIPFAFRIPDYIWDLLNPKGLERLVLACRAVSKAEIEPLRQSVDWCCLKYCLIFSLYQRARAPPQYTLLSNVLQRLAKHIKSLIKTLINQ